MARIRSIHPGLFTDEAFASLSMAARVLLLGIWTEADDQGVFEWKPVTLKMRIFSADNLDVIPLLEELTAANSIRQFSLEGKLHGAVRNFCRYQKPKTPKYRAVTDDEIRNYVASKYPKEETAASQPETFPQNGEIDRQREEGGDSLFLGGGKGEGEKSAPPKAASQGLGSQIDPGFQPIPEAIDRCHEQGATDAEIDSEVRKFIAHHQVKQTFSPNWAASWAKWWENWKPHKAKTRTRSEPAAALPVDWDAACSQWVKLGRWPRGHGSDPDSPACRAPPEILAKYGLRTMQ
ncbi:hypothetical protein IVB34_12700 [Bradyrhizobium sp. 2]|uniref:hypothetical protein n=1 Tax=Bradyrhizobium sp. 2 TaxID=190045 RepID=UPI001FF7FBE7|nr:hypothetical protein [Bradyrhizobium sp. 2]MCK1459214.1 hypothetical protein [Bradyrhizobium sp. 2]